VYCEEQPLSREKVYLNETEEQVRQWTGTPDKIHHGSKAVYWRALFRDSFSCGSAYLHDEEPILTEYRDRHYSVQENHRPLKIINHCNFLPQRCLVSGFFL
ncbi:TPA: hypothetical protein ACJGSF_005642, partial [Salmonella enterica subsp. enterica serovar Muenchen]